MIHLIKKSKGERGGKKIIHSLEESAKTSFCIMISGLNIIKGKAKKILYP